jgi:inhibitor of KinA
MKAAPRFLDAGEAALSVEFGARVDPELNAQVLALDAALRRAAIDGVMETVPTYRALMIHYEPLTLPRETLIAEVRALLHESSAAAAPRARWIVPVSYAPEDAEDLAALAAIAGVSPQQARALQEGAEYRAYMYGFAPGWLYLGGLPAELAVPRRATPRPPTPEGAILVGGGLALIAANSMPTGWYVVARTPERLFSPAREPAFFIEPGDAIRFEGVVRDEFAALEMRAQTGEIVARRELLA